MHILPMTAINASPPRSLLDFYCAITIFTTTKAISASPKHEKLIMQNELHIQGIHNIVIQGVTDSTLTLNINGEAQEIRNELAALACWGRLILRTCKIG